MFQRLREFHHAFGHLVAETPAFPEQTIRDLRIELLNEELDEFCHASAARDMIEMADGLADMCVIIAGTMVSYGIAPDGQFVSPFPDGTVSSEGQVNYPVLLRENFDDYVLAEQDNDLEAVQRRLMIMLLNICGVAMKLKIPLNAVFAEVHRSNLSKLMPDGTVLYREDRKILKGPNYSPPDIAGVFATFAASSKSSLS